MSEKETDARARADTRGDFQEVPVTLKADWSAEERYYNRSKKIRRMIIKWMIHNQGRLFPTEEEMAGEAANEARCSSVTARRWLSQYSRNNALFQIVEQDAGYVIWARNPPKEGTPA